MARIRTIKPELAAHEGLFDLERETQLPIRFAWCMLFTVADREGRFSWRPRTLKAQIVPHDEIDFSRVLDAWLTRGFVVKYRVKGDWFGWIPTFTKHQVINNREAPSDLPSLDAADEVIDSTNNDIDACGTREPREDDASATREVHAQAEGRKEGKGKEGKGTDASTTRAGKFDPATVVGLDVGAWNAWVAYRAERKPAIKPVSMQAAAEELAAFGDHQAAVVRHSKANGYQGLVAPKANGANGNGKASGANPVITDAWTQVVNHVRCGGYRNGSGLGDPIDAAVRSVGGYTSIGQATERDLPFIERRFRAAMQERLS